MTTTKIQGARALGAGLYITLLVSLLSGCGQDEAPWAMRNVTGLMPPLDFALTDAGDGEMVHGEDFRGKVALLYFGYTHCPDVCPTTLSELSRALATLGKDAEQVRVLFVTVDPARDTLPTLKAYAAAFGPQIVGLRGNEQEIKALTKRYRVSYGYGKPDAQGNYEVSHSSAVYVFDQEGKVRLLVEPGSSPEVIAGDLERLLAEKPDPSA